MIDFPLDYDIARQPRTGPPRSSILSRDAFGFPVYPAAWSPPGMRLPSIPSGFPYFLQGPYHAPLRLDRPMWPAAPDWSGLYARAIPSIWEM